jgi:2-iminoacetate synthase ThiH
VFFISEATTTAPEGTAYVAVRCAWQPGDTLDIWKERLAAFSRGETAGVAYVGAGFIQRLAHAENLPVAKVIGGLSERGTNSITAGEAELFDAGLRRDYAGDAITAEQWMEVHRAAHLLGHKTTAGMVYGTVDHPAEYAAHLNAIRRLQEETGGFAAFVPMALHNRGIASHLTAPTAAQSLRATAISRAFLDNIPHIATAPSLISTEVAVVALDHGADLVDLTVAVADVRSEDRRAGAEVALKVLDGASVRPAALAPWPLRETMEEARWTAVAVDAALNEGAAIAA